MHLPYLIVTFVGMEPKLHQEFQQRAGLVQIPPSKPKESVIYLALGTYFLLHISSSIETDNSTQKLSKIYAENVPQVVTCLSQCLNFEGFAHHVHILNHVPHDQCSPHTIDDYESLKTGLLSNVPEICSHDHYVYVLEPNLRYKAWCYLIYMPIGVPNPYKWALALKAGYKGKKRLLNPGASSQSEGYSSKWIVQLVYKIFKEDGICKIRLSQ